MWTVISRLPSRLPVIKSVNSASSRPWPDQNSCAAKLHTNCISSSWPSGFSLTWTLKRVFVSHLSFLGSQMWTAALKITAKHWKWWILQEDCCWSGSVVWWLPLLCDSCCTVSSFQTPRSRPPCSDDLRLRGVTKSSETDPTDHIYCQFTRQHIYCTAFKSLSKSFENSAVVPLNIQFQEEYLNCIWLCWGAFILEKTNQKRTSSGSYFPEWMGPASVAGAAMYCFESKCYLMV